MSNDTQVKREADRREVLKIINAQVVAAHNLNADPHNFVINQNSLADAFDDLLATVRREDLKEAVRNIHRASFIEARHCSIEFLNGAEWARNKLAEIIAAALDQKEGMNG